MTFFFSPFFFFSILTLKSACSSCPRCVRGSAGRAECGRALVERRRPRAVRTPQEERRGGPGRALHRDKQAPHRDPQNGGAPPRERLCTGPHHTDEPRSGAQARPLAPPAGSGPGPAQPAAAPRRGAAGKQPRSGRELRLSPAKFAIREGKRGRSLAAALQGAPARSWQVAVSREQQLCPALPYSFFSPSSTPSEGQKLKADASPVYAAPEHKPTQQGANEGGFPPAECPGLPCLAGRVSPVMGCRLWHSELRRDC